MTKPQDPIRIGEQEFKFDALSPEAQTLVQHMMSIDGKLNSHAFEIQQLQFGRQAVYTQLIAETGAENDDA